ncbi:uncharacterized protein LOC107013283 [Solanum pennellii]|uniref:Uncharacterized protein LOC107013283 n=1 Tax=Solanum pennellii TaxID=28526 RepID=A0ABM1GBK6_SOLPN|nr:uncharacterized protein LOC107013283 [Solanum pennellii]
MATLLHHIQPWMQKSITESEARLEKKMQQFTERKIAEVNQRLDAFELRVLARPAPPKRKKYHNQKIEKREFAVGDLVLLLNSRLRLFPSKLKSEWTGPFLITKVFPNGAVELENKEGAKFTVNGQKIKIYLGHAESAHEVVEAYHLDEV